jgi:hypothetical protein
MYAKRASADDKQYIAVACWRFLSCLAFLEEEQTNLGEVHLA